jgi:hypothetical protein
MAAKSNIDCIKTIEALIEKGAIVDLPDKDGATPLLQASYSGDVNLVKFLLEYGKANIDLADNEGNTALQIITEKKITIAEDIITKLISEKHELYPLLKMIGNLADDGIKDVAKHLEDLKTISDKISDFIKGVQPSEELQPSEKLIQAYGKDLASKLVKPGIIKELNSDIISMILINLLPEDLKKRLSEEPREELGEELTSKLVKNLLKMHSTSTQATAETSPSAQSSQIADSKTEAPRSPSPEARAQGTSQLAPESPRDRS